MRKESCKRLQVGVFSLESTQTQEHLCPPPGERYVYKFVCDPEALFQMAGPGDRLKVEQEQANQVESNITSNSAY